ncbi:CBU_0592 family membrane protein [Desulfosediminicola flagellatus]|uniref:CBU_0592 family membrane protein n=1 Tax=Desulfosediminicola flagellatus TaxID=2569541 RepID=UPI0010AD7BAD
MNGYHWYDLIGNIGVFMILIAYFMLQLNRINTHSLSFCLMNFCGAFLIMVSLYFDFNLSAFVIEFFWLLISIFGIYKWLRQEHVLRDPQK